MLKFPKARTLLAVANDDGVAAVVDPAAVEETGSITGRFLAALTRTLTVDGMMRKISKLIR
jgi:hypothetical protein